MAAGKIDKVSGDIRVCFEILRQTIERKYNEFKSVMRLEHYNQNRLRVGDMAIGIGDVNKVIVDMFESKLAKFIKKIPLSHLLYLQVITRHFSEKMSRNEKSDEDAWIKDQQLLKLVNAEGAKKYMDKISMGEVADLTQTLVNSDILLA